MPIGEVPNIEEFASNLGCQISSLPMKYLELGFPLGASFKANSIWDPIAYVKETKLGGRKCICRKGSSHTFFFLISNKIIIKNGCPSTREAYRSQTNQVQK